LPKWILFFLILNFSLSRVPRITMKEHCELKNAPLIFYDGHCSFCHQSVQFILRRDSSAIFHFAPLQGSTAKTHLPRHLREDTDTLILLDKAGNYHTESTSVLKILVSLGNVYFLAGFFLWVPRPVRDFVYRWIAKNRYRWFPKTSCLIPTSAERSRFLS
jgi:predicted DCC family thiol-disulfide oxidoreductase YuxK